MLARLVFFFVAMMTSAGIADAREISRFNVGGWRITANTNDSGNFSNCMASASYRSGIYLYFFIDNEYKWSFGFFGGRISSKNGQIYDILFKIDDGKIYQFKSIGIGNDIISVPLSGNSEIFNAMKRGRVLTTHVQGQISSFNLDATSKMLSELLNCAERKGFKAAPSNESDLPKANVTTTQPSNAGPKNSESGTISTGSGFFVTADGAGLTNAHVVDGCKTATISGYGTARIAALDKSNDLALVQLNPPVKTPYARLRRKPLQLGETVYVMGFPLAGQLDNGLNFTSGLVSSLAGMGNDTRLLQLTAPIQPGNSGGPIADSSGLVVGIVKSKFSEVAALKDTGSLPQNINFGIKIDLAANFLRANSGEAIELESLPPQEATTVAREGRTFTFQIKCTVE